MSSAAAICQRAGELVAGDRQSSHGDKMEGHANVAALWNAYLRGRQHERFALTPKDVALMMALLKVARTKTGAHNPDDYVDLAGYAGCAGEIADRQEAG